MKKGSTKEECVTFATGIYSLGIEGTRKILGATSKKKAASKAKSAPKKKAASKAKSAPKKKVASKAKSAPKKKVASKAKKVSKK